MSDSDSDNVISPDDTIDRIFLVVVDETEEMNVALRFACQRARHTGGRVALLYVIEPSDFQHWRAVEELMREEARSEGEQLLQRLAAQVNELVGAIPILYVREAQTEEMNVALRFACQRARHTGGRVALLYVIEPSDFQHWRAVEELMREEARSEGEQLLQRLAAIATSRRCTA